MTFQTIISPAELVRHLEDPEWAVFDCRFSLAEPQRGHRDYLQAHIPGAVYAHLNDDLSAPVVPGVTSRHPLPSIEQTAVTFSAWGIDARVQVVAYDDAGGALAAVRLWWMLRWLGHPAAAILDGGWQAGQREYDAVQAGVAQRSPRKFVPRPRPDLLATTAEVESMRLDPSFKVFDCRTADRYRGENETIDPIAGHIPGAISAPYPENLNADLSLRSKESLLARYKDLLGDTPAERTAFYCGSGVTSILNILAIQAAGLGEARLYAGSWSEWITDPARPVAVGESRF
jgi:thiosulfate/3-mercaptopyruvate sulfurtransferase